VLLLIVLVTGCGGPASRLHSHMERGREYFAKGDYAHAGVEFRNASQIDPKDVDSRVMSAQVAEKLGQFRQAVTIYQQLVDQAPQTVEARVGLGRLFVLAGTPEQALEVIEPGLIQHPDNAGLLTVRALARARNNDDRGALDDVNAALAHDPTNEDAIGLRAGFYRKAGDVPAAIKLVSEAVTQRPQSANLHEVLVQLYASASDLPQTERELQALIQLKPADLNFRKQLALLYTREHKVPQARTVLEQATTVDPKNNDAKLTLVDFVSSQQKPAEGVQLLRNYLANDPDNFDLRFRLGEMLSTSGDRRQALQVYEEVIRRDGTGNQGLKARDRIAAIHSASGNEVAARKLVAEVLAKNPRDEEALLLRSEFAMKDRDPEAAIGYLRAVLRDRPSSGPIQSMLARAYQANGQVSIAEQTLRTAMVAAPQDSSLRAELGDLLVSQKRADEAVKLLEEAVRADPGDVRLRESLIRAYLVQPNLEAARTGAEDLKTLRPNAAAGFYYAGLAAEGQHEPDEAEQNYERGLALSPEAIDLLTAVVRLDLARNRFAHASDVLKTAAARNPKNAAILNLQGELHLANKQSPAAIEAFQRAIAVAPQWWPSYRNLAVAKFAAKDEEGAVAAYRAGIQAAPQAQSLAIDLASYYERRGRIDTAIEVYEQWNQHTPRIDDIQNNLALLLVNHRTDRGSLDEAKALTAGFTDSSSSNYLDTKGWVHFKRAEYADALRVLEQASRNAPGSSEIRFHLGMTEAQLGRTERARSDLEAAVSGAQKAPWSQEARSALASLKAQPG
jgi:Tfp pilus assembly protein PilF